MEMLLVASTILLASFADDDIGMFSYHQNRVLTEKDVELSYVTVRTLASPDVSLSPPRSPFLAACTVHSVARSDASPGRVLRGRHAVGCSNCWMPCVLGFLAFGGEQRVCFGSTLFLIFQKKPFQFHLRD